jgi:hypothetical protein
VFADLSPVGAIRARKRHERDAIERPPRTRCDVTDQNRARYGADRVASSDLMVVPFSDRGADAAPRRAGTKHAPPGEHHPTPGIDPKRGKTVCRAAPASSMAAPTVVAGEGGNRQGFHRRDFILLQCDIL